MGCVEIFTIGTVITGDHALVLQPQSSLTLTRNCVVVNMLLNINGFTVPQPPGFWVVIFCQEFEVLDWNLYLITGIEVFANKIISSPIHAGFGDAIKDTVGIGFTSISTESVE